MSLEIPVESLVVFALASVRIFVVFMVAPVFGHTLVSMRVRIGFATSTALLVPAAGPLALGAMPLAIAVLHEVIVGLAFGFALTLVFAGVSLMGELASIQGGLGAASVLDPTSGASSLVLSTMLQTFALMLFLAVEGHHLVIRAAFASFEFLPIGGAGFDPAGFAALAAAGSLVFAVAVKFAAPITAVMLVTNTAVGALGRAIPQLNLMSLHLPAQIALLLLVLSFGAITWSEELARALIGHGEAAIAAFVGGR